MPPLIIGLGLLLTSSVGVFAFPALLGILGITGLDAIIGLGFALTLSGISNMLQKQPKAASTISQDLSSSQVTVRQATAPWAITVGRDRRGGILTFLHTTGANNEFLHMVITLTGRMVHSIGNMYFDGVLVPVDGSGNATGAFAGFVHIETNLGTDTQAAFPGLVSAAPTKWTSTDQQLGRAGVYVRLKWSADIFPNGAPNITFDIQGNEVYDPRTGTTGYTENPALHLRDFLINSIYGMGESDANIHDDCVIAAANVCDESVSLRDGGTELRYTCNGTFTVDQAIKDTIQAMLTSMGGTLVFAGGKWKMYAAAWRSPSLTLGDDDLRDSIKVQPLRSRRDLCNSVKGVYKGPLTDWQPADFPVVTNPTYITQDGEQIWQDVEFPFTVSPSTCQRLAKITLEKNRRQMQVSYPAKLSAYQAEPPDVVQINRSRFGWTNKTFEVFDGAFVVGDSKQQQGAPILGVDLSLQEIDANVYAWDPSTDETIVAAAATTTLPDNTTIGNPSSLTAISDTLVRADGVKITRLKVTWTSPADQFVLDGGHIVIDISDHADGSSPKIWRNAGQVDGGETQFFYNQVTDGHTYDVRIYSKNVSLATSDFVEIDNVLITGLTADLTSSAFGKQGSIRPTTYPVWTLATNSNSSGSCTQRYTAAATTLPLTDGTSINVPAVDVTWSGTLAATTTYLRAPRYKIADGTVHWAGYSGSNVDLDPPSIPATSSITQAQKDQMAINQYFDGYIPLSNGFLSATTPNNSGTGGGSSGGGPVCIHEDEIVDIEGLGRMRIFDAAPGGRICGEDVRTGERKYRRILGREIEHCSDWYAVKGHLMTSCEPVWTSGKWVSAHDVPDSRQVFGVPGRKVRIYVEGDNFDDHNFILFGADGDITVHNPIQLS